MASLAKELEKVVAQNKETFGVVVLLDENTDATGQKLKDFAARNGLSNVALTVNGSGPKPPGFYKINPEVKHTVLVGTGKKVVHNFALNEVGAGDLPAIVSAFKEVLLK